MDLARYGQTFKARVVARLLPPESEALEVVAREVGQNPPLVWAFTQLLIAKSAVRMCAIALHPRPRLNAPLDTIRGASFKEQARGTCCVWPLLVTDYLSLMESSVGRRILND